MNEVKQLELLDLQSYTSVDAESEVQNLYNLPSQASEQYIQLTLDLFQEVKSNMVSLPCVLDNAA